MFGSAQEKMLKLLLSIGLLQSHVGATQFGPPQAEKCDSCSDRVSHDTVKLTWSLPSPSIYQFHQIKYKKEAKQPIGCTQPPPAAGVFSDEFKNLPAEQQAATCLIDVVDTQYTFYYQCGTDALPALVNDQNCANTCDPVIQEVLTTDNEGNDVFVLQKLNNVWEEQPGHSVIRCLEHNMGYRFQVSGRVGRDGVFTGTSQWSEVIWTAALPPSQPTVAHITSTTASITWTSTRPTGGIRPDPRPLDQFLVLVSGASNPLNVQVPRADFQQETDACKAANNCQSAVVPALVPNELYSFTIKARGYLWPYVACELPACTPPPATATATDMPRGGVPGLSTPSEESRRYMTPPAQVTGITKLGIHGKNSYTATLQWAHVLGASHYRMQTGAVDTNGDLSACDTIDPMPANWMKADGGVCDPINPKAWTTEWPVSQILTRGELPKTHNFVPQGCISTDGAACVATDPTKYTFIGTTMGWPNPAQTTPGWPTPVPPADGSGDLISGTMTQLKPNQAYKFKVISAVDKCADPDAKDADGKYTCQILNNLADASDAVDHRTYVAKPVAPHTMPVGFPHAGETCAQAAEALGDVDCSRPFADVISSAQINLAWGQVEGTGDTQSRHYKIYQWRTDYSVNPPAKDVKVSYHSEAVSDTEEPNARFLSLMPNTQYVYAVAGLNQDGEGDSSKITGPGNNRLWSMPSSTTFGNTQNLGLEVFVVDKHHVHLYYALQGDDLSPTHYAFQYVEGGTEGFNNGNTYKLELPNGDEGPRAACQARVWPSPGVAGSLATCPNQFKYGPLEPNTVYNFKVAAENKLGYGIGQFSPPAAKDVTTLADKMQSFSVHVEGTEGQKLKLKWVNNPKNRVGGAGAQVLSYITQIKEAITPYFEKHNMYGPLDFDNICHITTTCNGLDCQTRPGLKVARLQTTTGLSIWEDPLSVPCDEPLACVDGNPPPCDGPLPNGDARPAPSTCVTTCNSWTEQGVCDERCAKFVPTQDTTPPAMDLKDICYCPPGPDGTPLCPPSCVDPPSVWGSDGFTARNDAYLNHEVVYPNLRKNSVYDFRIAIINDGGQSEWTYPDLVMNAANPPFLQIQQGRPVSKPTAPTQFFPQVVSRVDLRMEWQLPLDHGNTESSTETLAIDQYKLIKSDTLDGLLCVENALTQAEMEACNVNGEVFIVLHNSDLQDQSLPQIKNLPEYCRTGADCVAECQHTVPARLTGTVPNCCDDTHRGNNFDGADQNFKFLQGAQHVGAQGTGEAVNIFEAKKTKCGKSSAPLQRGHTYYFSLYARNNQGRQLALFSYYGPAAQAMGKPISAPAKPDTFTLTAETERERDIGGGVMVPGNLPGFHLTWTPPTDTGDGLPTTALDDEGNLIDPENNGGYPKYHTEIDKYLIEVAEKADFSDAITLLDKCNPSPPLLPGLTEPKCTDQDGKTGFTHNTKTKIFGSTDSALFKYDTKYFYKIRAHNTQTKNLGIFGKYSGVISTEQFVQMDDNNEVSQVDSSISSGFAYRYGTLSWRPVNHPRDQKAVLNPETPATDSTLRLVMFTVQTAWQRSFFSKANHDSGWWTGTTTGLDNLPARNDVITIPEGSRSMFQFGDGATASLTLTITYASSTRDVVTAITKLTRSYVAPSNEAAQASWRPALVGCCRSADNINNPGSGKDKYYNYRVGATLDLMKGFEPPNTSPVAGIFPTTTVISGKEDNKFFIIATDPDSSKGIRTDTLKWSFAADGQLGFPEGGAPPPSQPTPLKIDDAHAGLLSFDAKTHPTPGLYQSTIIVSDHKDTQSEAYSEVTVDFQIRVNLPKCTTQSGKKCTFPFSPPVKAVEPPVDAPVYYSCSGVEDTRSPLDGSNNAKWCQIGDVPVSADVLNDDAEAEEWAGRGETWDLCTTTCDSAETNRPPYFVIPPTPLQYSPSPGKAYAYMLENMACKQYQQCIFTMRAIDHDAGDTVEIYPSSVPTFSTMKKRIYPTTMPEVTDLELEWYPKSEHAGHHIVCFSAEDNRGARGPSHCITIHVLELGFEMAKVGTSLQNLAKMYGTQWRSLWTINTELGSPSGIVRGQIFRTGRVVTLEVGETPKDLVTKYCTTYKRLLDWNAGKFLWLQGSSLYWQHDPLRLKPVYNNYPQVVDLEYFNFQGEGKDTNENYVGKSFIVVSNFDSSQCEFGV